MSTLTTLVVPVEVAALAVNTQTRDTDGTYVFQRWQTNFRMLEEENLAPEPAPFDTELWPGDRERRGIYLQWQLPEALTRGAHDETEGIGDFPLVPNRWLVVRYRPGGRQVRTWLVQSDHLGTADDGPGTIEGTVSFADPHSDRLRATLIGLRHDVTATKPWREPADPGEPFLTAIGPGLTTFSAFQPYNENVFSLHDTLDDLADQGADRLSYHVVGWYSNPTRDDILTGRDGPLDDLLKRLEWSAPTATSTIDRSLYTGSALNIAWDPEGTVPESDCPGPDDIAVAVGNSVSEAMAGLQDHNAGPSALGDDEARMFRAFALGTLDALDRSDGAGDDITDRTAHQAGFGPVAGGYTWRVVDHTDSDPAGRTALSADQRAAEESVVADLNKTQAAHDALARRLAVAQDRLYTLWALSLESKQPAEFAEAITDELDPANPDGAAGTVARLADELGELRSTMPWGTTADSLAESAREFADTKGLARSSTLTRAPQDPYETGSDPVVLLQGSHLNAPLTRGSLLPCRTTDRLVTAIGANSSGSVTTDVAQVNTTGLPAEIPAALTEFFLLARARAAAGDAALPAATGSLPEYGTGPWRQPWQPLYLLWEADYTPLPYREGDAERWHFDGTRYRWRREEDTEISEAITIQGRQTLAPTAGHETEGRIAAHAAHRGDLPADVIARLREEARTEDLLSQSLDGLGAALNQRDPSVSPQPDGDLGTLIGDTSAMPPVPGKAPAFPWQKPEDSRFHELRAGQIAFTGLSVVDRFGRAVNLISDPLHFEPVLPTTMVPDFPVEELAAKRFAELSPRLLQPARLRFDFLDATRDDQVDITPGTNPVCAWLTHNRLDRTLVCFDPAGVALGELRTIKSAQGPRIVHWAALPGSTITSLPELARVSPHTARFLTAIEDGGPDVLDAVRATLDEALASIDPDGPEDPGLGFLLGRPLALVRARLDLELHGEARRSIAWSQVLAPDEPELPAYEWTIRLGEATHTDDGLVGYVLDDDYAHFDTVVPPKGTSNGYLRWIDDGSRLRLSFGGDSSAVATLLVDPRAAVHATTDILPVGTLHVPQDYTAQALARMSVSFRTGPMLARVVDGAAIMPHPATATGSWSWAQAAGDAWEKLPITVPDPAGMPAGSAQIRSGFMVLDDAASATRTNGDST